MLRKKLDRYPAARIYVKEFVNGSPISAPIAVRVIGPDLDVIEKLSAQVEKLLEGGTGHARCAEPTEGRAHESATRRSIRRRPASSACRRWSSTAPSASLLPECRPARSRIPAASSTTSWFARQSALAPISTRWVRCVSRRSNGQTSADLAARDAGVRSRTDPDPAL